MLALCVFSPSRGEETPLTIAPGPENSLQVELSNDTEVRGVQFTLSGVKITEVRPTGRTKGFLAKFNEKTGVVLMASISGNNIPAGKGSIAVIICDNPKGAALSGVTVVEAFPPKKYMDSPIKPGNDK